jgi:FAD/FMN-containing dehydrogenase
MTEKTNTLQLESTEPGLSGIPSDRRRFMMAGAALGAGAAFGASALVGRSRADTRPAAGPTNADWAALRSKLSTHTLSRPGDRSYPLAHQLFDPRFDFLHPSGIAYCGNATDVSTALTFVKKFKLRFRVRSGGHSYAGWSSLDGGLVIDVSKINHFRVGNGTITVGAGLDLIHLYENLAAHGLAIPGGSCPTVGLAGLALGGGIGVLSRQYGLTCDAIESLQIVTADGAVLNCDGTQHTDLLWASKGGGGGNFGVATSFTLRTHKLSGLVVFFLQWPFARANRVISGWQSWAPHGPSELWSNMHLSSAFGGTPQISVGGTWLGSVAGANRAIRSLIARVGAQPSFISVVHKTFLQAMLYEAGCSNLTVMQCNTTPSGVLPRVPSFAKSDFFTDRLPASGIQAAINAIELAGGVRGPQGGGAAIAFDALGGAVNQVRPQATAFVHRDALWDIQYSTSWTSPGSASGVAHAHAWLRDAYADLHPHANGQAYQNYIDPDLKNWRQAYYGANYPRLSRIKHRYDPHNLFNFPQSIT